VPYQGDERRCPIRRLRIRHDATRPDEHDHRDLCGGAVIIVPTIAVAVLRLFIYHVVFVPVVIDDPIGAMGMLLAAWFSGVAIGTVFLPLKLWEPDAVKVMTSIYSRASMIAYGKMFVANTLPSSMLVLFDWNPLFHTIDQARGYIFLHYDPHFSDPIYPVIVSLGLVMMGMMGEFYTRKSASISWSATR